MAQQVLPDAAFTIPEIWYPTVSPDGTKVAYSSNPVGTPEIFVKDVEDGRTVQLSNGEFNEAVVEPQLEWHSSGEYLFVKKHRHVRGTINHYVHTISLDGELEQLLTDSARLPMEMHPAKDMLLFSDISSERNGLFEYSLSTGEERNIVDLEDGWKSILYASYNQGGELIAYEVQQRRDRTYRVHIVDTCGNAVETVDPPGSEKNSSIHLRDWHPSEDRLLLAVGAGGDRFAYTYDLKSGISQSFCEADHVDPRAFLPNGDGFIGLAYRHGGTQNEPVIRRFDGSVEWPAGETETTELFRFSHRPSGVFAGEDTCVLLRSQAGRPAELVQYDYTDGTAKILESTRDEASIDFYEPEYVEYSSSDGVTIGAMLYRTGRSPSPGLVIVHGGPYRHVRADFRPEAQYLCNLGYTVMLPNFRGSTGRGEEFKRLLAEQYGEKEQHDISAGGRYLAELDDVDGSRVGVFGHSYGGYSAILQSQLFPSVWNACIAWNPGVFEQAKDPLDLEEPLRAPLCLIYGEHDHNRDWSEELIAHVESDASHEPDAFEYHRLSDVGHHTVNPERKSEVWRIASAFMRTHLE